MRRPTGLRVALVAAVLATAALGAGAVAAPTPLPKLPVVAPSTLLGPRTAAPADLHVTRKRVTPKVARALGTGGELRGFGINYPGAKGRIVARTVADFPRMAAEGINTVSVYIYLYLPDQQGSTVTTGTDTPTDAELQLVTSAAQASGLAVHFMPVLRNNTDRVWQGYFLPTDVRAFFASYTTAVNRYADLAQSLGVTMFYIGAEDVYLEPFAAQWRALAASVRRHYTGALSYMTIPLTAPVVKFWDAVDVGSISAYFSMGEDARPSYDRFMAAWREAHVPTVNRIVRALKGRPLVFGEVGYASQAGTFTHPNEGARPSGRSALTAQADGYRALLDTLARAAGVYGVSWWNWETGTTALDQGYSPAGKAAECVIAQHWSPSADVRDLASQSICDLSPLDALLGKLPPLP